MKNINDLTENDCIKIDNCEDGIAILKLNKTNTCYFPVVESEYPQYYLPKRDNCRGVYFYYGDVRKDFNIKNLTIHQAKDFLKPEFEFLEKVLVWDNYDTEKEICIFIGYNSKGIPIIEDNDGDVFCVDNIEKIDHKRNEAIDKIKSIAKENGINLKEI